MGESGSGDEPEERHCSGDLEPAISGASEPVDVPVAAIPVPAITLEVIVASSNDVEQLRKKLGVAEGTLVVGWISAAFDYFQACCA